MKVMGATTLCSFPPRRVGTAPAPKGLPNLQLLQYDKKNPRWTFNFIHIVRHLLGGPLGSLLRQITGGICRA